MRNTASILQFITRVFSYLEEKMTDASALPLMASGQLNDASFPSPNDAYIYLHLIEKKQIFKYASMRKLIYLLFLFIPFSLFAQQRTITGKVTDDAGAALSGVTVSVSGNDASRAATVTNTAGNYSINVPAGVGELVFSFVGKKTITESINGRAVINVEMAVSDEQMADVVVIGYGTKKKAALTGAISNINADEINTSTNPSIAQKLQGKVAGLNIRQNSGQPGSFDNNINVRGFGSPLYVIDGIIRNDAGAFQKLNPEDIESISILKDASAAVYGIGAANGVVIVTTKQGSRGKALFSYSAVVGITSPTDVPKMATAAQFAQLRSASDYYLTGTPKYTKEELQKYLDGKLPGYTNVDWYDAVMKKSAIQTQHNLSVSGGSERVMYYVGLEYMRDGGLLKSEDMGYNRVNVRSNLTAELTKTLRARLFLAGRWDKQEQPGDNFFNIFKTTRVTSPLEHPYANDNPAYPGFVSSGFENPVILAERDLSGYTENETRAIQSQMELRWAVPFVKNLYITGTGAFDTDVPMTKNLFKGFNAYTYVPATGVYNAAFRRDQSITTGFSNNNTFTLRAAADYKVEIAGNHEISLTAVAEQIKGWNRSVSAKRYYGAFYTLDQIQFAPVDRTETGGSDDRNARISYIGRVSYAFSKKYFLDAAFNYQGSYRYNPDGGRWGFFPVVSAAWAVSEEDFIRNNLPAISILKLRGSYGILGTDQGAPWQYIPGILLGGNGNWEFSNGNVSNGLPSPVIVNPRITWSENYHSDLGIDLSLWNGKLSLTADVYNRENKRQLGRRTIALPNTFGGILPEENINSSRNRGIDIELGHRGVVGELRYTVTGIFNYNRTMTRHQERAPFQSQRDRWINGNENRWGNFLTGYIVDGQFQSQEEVWNGPVYGGAAGGIRELPGDFKYKDVNNDGIINDEDARTPYAWGPTPLINYGLTMSAQWKGFDANLLFQGAGAYTTRFNEVYGEMFAFGGNLPQYFFDSWHQADIYNPKSAWIPGEWPVARTNNNVGMLYAESAVWRRNSSYVRLKNVELGYTFNTQLLQAAGIQRLRVYANAFNLVTWAKDPFMAQFDPEKSNGAPSNNPAAAAQGFTYPLSKNYNFGLTVSF
jgi:TonB-linked SusC/RagA family outer membrane protein